MLETLNPEKLKLLTEEEIKLLEKFANTRGCMIFRPNGKQQEFIDLVGSGKYFVNVFCAANGVGKTTIGINVLIEFLYKEKLNNHFPDYFPDYKHPIRARIASDPTTIEKKIVPELKKWLPKGTYKTFKGRKPYEYEWRFSDGSNIDILTYEQDDKEFESVDLDIILLDEPPTREKFTACVSRLRKGGLIMIVMTPLAGAGWIIDKREDPDWGFVYADVESNCIDHGHHGILKHRDIERMIAQYDPDERDARAKGEFLCLAGLIYKSFNKEVHAIPRRKLEKAVYGMTVDPHAAKPFFMVWWALLPNGHLVFIDEYPNDDYEALKRVKSSIKDYYEIIKIKEQDIDVKYRFMDPNMGNSPDMFNGLSIKDQFRVYQSQLGMAPENQMFFDTEIDDNIDARVLAVKTRLSYDTTKELTGNNVPTIYFFDNCKNTIKHMLRWGYKDWKSQEGRSWSERVQDKHKDGADCVGYTVIKNPIYELPKGGSYAHYRAGSWRRR